MSVSGNKARSRCGECLHLKENKGEERLRHAQALSCPPDSGGTAALLLTLRDIQDGRVDGGRGGEEQRGEKQQELVKETGD